MRTNQLADFCGTGIALVDLQVGGEGRGKRKRRERRRGGEGGGGKEGR